MPIYQVFCKTPLLISDRGFDLAPDPWKAALRRGGPPRSRSAGGPAPPHPLGRRPRVRGFKGRNLEPGGVFGRHEVGVPCDVLLSEEQKATKELSRLDQGDYKAAQKAAFWHFR